MSDAKSTNDTINIQIVPGYKSEDPNLSNDEKAARKFLENTHKVMIAMGRMCYIPAFGISVFTFLAGGLLPPASLPVLANVSSMGWTAWQINIAARTTVFYVLGSPLTDAAVWIKKHLPKDRSRLSKQEELNAAIEWKAVEFSTDYVQKVEPMTELDIQRINITNNIKTDPKYAKKLIKEYRKKSR